ncbi:MAG: DUF4845 domain-containing protein [Rhodocyclaceae bacterium]|nr:DUF4845 domain-containing protein [Rhodocyclaceae bacterium]
MKTLRKAVKRQHGFTLVGMLIMALVVLLLALLVMRVVPALMEYFTIRNDVNALVKSGELKGASVPEVREAFSKRAQVDDITAISPTDLDISKEGSELVIGFAYTKKIPLFGPVNLTIDFQGATKPGG